MGLVADAVSGAPTAREALFRRHWRLVWRRAYAVTGRVDLADDVTQDTFERAFRSLGRFRREEGRFEAWISRIAVNRAIDILRSEQRTVPLDTVADVPWWDVEPGGDRALQAAVAQLDPDRRAVLVLRFWLDLDPPEIAAALGVPVGTVHSRTHRALADLRALLGEGAS
ncbi:MAG: RNA polymerase sigma factor [Thermoleophilia bacterium]